MTHERYIGLRMVWIGSTGRKTKRGMIYDTTKPRQPDAKNPAARYAFVASVDPADLDAALEYMNEAS